MTGKKYKVLFLALLVVLNVVFIYLTYVGPWDPDELDHLHVGWLISKGLHNRVDFNGYLLQTYKWILGGLIPIFGTKNLLLYRWLSVLLATLGLVAYFDALRKIIGYAGSFFSVFVLTVSFSFLMRATQVRSDMLVFGCLSFALWLALLHLENEKVAPLAAAGMMCGIAAALRPTTLAFATAIGLVVLVRVLKGTNGRMRSIWPLTAFIGLFGAAGAVSFFPPFRIRGWDEFRSMFVYLTDYITFLGPTASASADAKVLTVIRHDHALYLLSLLGFIFFLGHLWRRRKKSIYPETILVLALVFYCPLLVVKRYVHMQDMLPLAYGLAPYFGFLIVRFLKATQARKAQHAFVWIIVAGILIGMGVHSFGVVRNEIRYPDEQAVREKNWAECKIQKEQGKIPMNLLLDTRCEKLAPDVMESIRVSRKKQEAVTGIFLATTQKKDRCFSTNALHLFRHNTPSFSPPNMAFYFAWWGPRLIHDLPKSIMNRLELLFTMPPYTEFDGICWKASSLTADERLAEEFRRYTPKVILIDPTLVRVASANPFFAAFLSDNYVGAYCPNAGSLFGFHRTLAASEIDLWSKGQGACAPPLRKMSWAGQ